MGVNVFFAGSENAGLEQLFVQIGEKTGKPPPPLNLGRAEEAGLSHDRGLWYAYDFLRHYALYVLQHDRAPEPSIYDGVTAPAHARLSPTAVYGEPPEERPTRWQHLVEPILGDPSTIYMPDDFKRPGAFDLGYWLVLASAPALLRDLEELNEHLGADRAALEPLWALEAQGRWDLESIDDLAADDDPFALEKEAWLRSTVFATLAVKHRLAIVAE